MGSSVACSTIILIIACLIFTEAIYLPVIDNSTVNPVQNTTNSSSSNINETSNIFFPFVLQQDEVDLVFFTAPDNDTDNGNSTSTGNYSTRVFRRSTEKNSESQEDNCDKEHIMFINNEDKDEGSGLHPKTSGKHQLHQTSSITSVSVTATEKSTTSSTNDPENDSSSSTTEKSTPLSTNLSENPSTTSTSSTDKSTTIDSTEPDLLFGLGIPFNVK